MDRPVSYKGDQPFIFISYAHRDSEAVWPIISRMQRDGYRVWYDDGIDPGTEWDENIANHVEGCSYFIALLSEGYLASENCRDELNFARDLNKDRLLIYLSDVTLPAGLRMRLSRLQAVHWYTYGDRDKAFAKLYEAKGLGICRDRPVGGAPARETTGAAPAAGDAEALYQKGREYYIRKEYAQAFPYCLRAAKQGYAAAQDILGAMYHDGRGVTQDYAEAVRWFRTAAEQGYAEAQSHLGYLYRVGHGVPRNDAEAFRWYRAAAEQGDAMAQYKLGIIYEEGQGVTRDKAEAAKWYRAAAEQDHAKAQAALEKLV